LKVPVAAHVMVVGHLVQRAGWDDATVAAAVLHDVIEDGNRYGEELRFEELGVLLGEQVAKLVLEVTERKYDEDGAPRSWRQRKSDYVENLRDVSPEAVAISLADKLHNLWSINESITQGIDVFSDAPQRRRLSAGPSEQIWFYEAVLDVSRSCEDNRLRDLRKDLQLEIGRFRDLVTKLPT
jgi:hypothetical protein